MKGRKRRWALSSGEGGGRETGQREAEDKTKTEAERPRNRETEMDGGWERQRGDRPGQERSYVWRKGWEESRKERRSTGVWGFPPDPAHPSCRLGFSLVSHLRSSGSSPSVLGAESSPPAPP